MCTTVIRTASKQKYHLTYFSFLFLAFTLFTPPIFSQSKVKDHFKLVFKNYLLIFMLCLFTATFTNAQFKNLDKQKNAFNTLKSKHVNAQAKWNIKTGVAASIIKFKEKINKGDIEKSVMSFIKSNKELLGIEKIINDLEVVETCEILGVTQIKIQQEYKKVPVEQSEYFVIIDSNTGEIVAVNGRLFPDINIDTKESIDELSAQSTAQMSMNNGYPLLEIKNHGKVIYHKDDIDYLAWKFYFNFYPHDAISVFIDANKNVLIDSYSTYLNATGKANVYQTNPTGGLTQNITLDRLNTNKYLRGTYIHSITGFDGNETFMPGGYFLFEPNDPDPLERDKFDEANVYWHIDNIAHNYFANLGVTKLPINVFFDGNRTGGAYDSDNDQMIFGRASSTANEPTRSNDVIYHEYSHSINRFLGLLGGGEDETRSKGEGYADYFTAAFTEDPKIMEWYTIPYDHLTNVSNDPTIFNYNNWNNAVKEGIGLIHGRGMIWSGALWDLRQTIGSTVTDDLVIKGLPIFPGRSSFEDGMDGIISAASTYYPLENYEQTIRSIFGNRGIGNPSAPENFTLIGNVGNNPYLTWDSHGDPEVAGYKIYQSINNGEYNLLTTLASRFTTSFIDYGTIITGERFDPTVCYVVTAIDIYNQESIYTVPRCVKSDSMNKDKGDQNKKESPGNITIENPYPNPFNSQSNIKLILPASSNVEIRIFNSLGESVQFFNKVLSAGGNVISITNSNLVSGIYYYSIRVSNSHLNEFSTGKLIYIK